MEITAKEVYNAVYNGYSDALSVADVGKILNINEKSVYAMVRNNPDYFFKAGRQFRIAKINLMIINKIFEPIIYEHLTT